VTATAWKSAGVNLGPPLNAIASPVKSVLTVLEAIQAILESLLKLLKTFMLDLTNPIKAMLALLLAAVRAIINQLLTSASVNVLFVLPDFRKSDIRAMLGSVTGGYQAFENKVVGKFYDTSDIFAPKFGAGQYVAMLVLYVGTDSTADLLRFILQLLSLLNNPFGNIALAAPAKLTVKPPNKSGDPITQFWRLFEPSEGNNSLVLEWQMPTTASGIASPTLMGQLTACLPAFNLGQKFLIERTSVEYPQGQTVYYQQSTMAVGKRVSGINARYNVPSVSSLITVKEPSGGVYKHFSTRKLAQNITYLGAATGTYRYIDTNLTPGMAYYYRVRCYMGDISPDYLNTFISNNVNGNNHVLLLEPFQSGFINETNKGPVINFGNAVVGKPSPTVRGFCPRNVSLTTANNQSFTPYDDIFDAVMAGLLLNFELPPANGFDDKNTIDMKTGWGSLSILSGQVGPIKKAYPLANDFVNNILAKASVRRLLTVVLEQLYTQPMLVARMSSMWAAGVKRTVKNILNYANTPVATNPSITVNGTTTTPGPSVWYLYGVIGDFGGSDTLGVYNYLTSSNNNYQLVYGYTGPLPLLGEYGIEKLERSDLAEFLHLLMSLTKQGGGYLRWHSISIGDLLPSIMPYIYMFEQWLLGLLKAIESALQEIVDIIATLIQRIVDLEQLLQMLLKIIGILSISINAGILLVTGNDGNED
jgi:hypothetical protein